ncbi:MAG TPA: FAD-dependent oxidoreductase [Intrasporangium sp.]|uniref:FAD-dependent oxidoreductase n=1 Tax=Intrasporangium sp. TaxID=1925024 RepID=UPI002F95524F
MSEPATHDAVFIGWGKGNKTLAAFLAARGESVLMIEQSDLMYGGTCINIGCVPTKALVESANHPSTAGSPSVRYTDAIERKDALTALLRGKNYTMVDSHDTATVITGRARFVGKRELEVTAGGETISVRGDKVFIGTGSVPMLPPIPGLDGPRVVTSTELIDRTELPPRLVVVGAGSIGLELATTYASFGSTVTVVDAVPDLLPSMDRDVADLVASVLADSGIEVILGASVDEISDTGSAAVVHLTTSATAGSKTQTVEADLVLAALGRRAATDGLGLDAAGVAVTEKGAIVVDDRLRTTADGVWAIGDVNGGPQFTYVSLDDFRIVRDQLVADGTRTTRDRRAVPTTTFITPPLAHVGLTEKEARGEGYDIKVASKRVDTIAAMPRARIVGDTRGIIKVIVDAATDLVLGATVFCVDSQEIINLVALAMRHDVTATELRDTIYTHPSSTEALNEVLTI